MNFKNQLKKIILSILIFLGSTSTLVYSNPSSDNTNTHTNPNARFAEAVTDENITALEELIAAGVNVNNPEIVNFLGRTPLHQAAFMDNIPMVRLLLDEGADVHALNPSRRTPLYWAAINGNKAIVLMLLEKDADPEHIDYFDRTAAFWANQNKHFHITDILNNADEQTANNN